MRKSRPLGLKIVRVVLTLAAFGNAHAQTSTSAASKSETPAKDPKLEQKALALLNEVVAQAPALKLPDNQVRVQLIVGDLLWDRDEGRARDLFNAAGAAVAQLMAAGDVDRPKSDLASGLRRDLVLAVARHDTELAFQLLRSTRPAVGDTRFNDGEQVSLEQSLVAIVAAKDPIAAYKKIMDLLDDGKYPSEIASLLHRLYSKDHEAFEKLSKKLLSRLTADDLISSYDAGNLAVSLLQQGPIPDSDKDAAKAEDETGKDQALVASAYRDLMEAATTAALTALPRAPGQSASILDWDTKRLRRNEYIVSDDRVILSMAMIKIAEPGDQRQNNARTMLERLSPLLPRIDQYLPGRAPAIRQKLNELGIGDDRETAIDLENRNSESLMAAAKSAPARMQPEIYEQAAEKALNEGNLDRALQIANEHLDATKREATIRAVELKRMAINPSPEQLEHIRKKLAALPTNSLRVTALIDLAANAQKTNPKLALKFLDDAAGFVGRRARNYEDFSDQLRVAEAFASLDLKRSFAILEAGIAQLNEILSAAAVVNGFEADVFREEELPLEGGSELGKMVSRYGWELGSLAKLDFDSARGSADKFQPPETRLFARLLIAKRVLGGQENDF